MRFAITAAARYLGVLESFVRAGWKPLRLFTLPVDNHLDSCKGAAAFARRHGAGVQFERLRTEHLAELASQGCDALIVASYPWRILDWKPYLKYAVNIHCSPLPEGLGPYPFHQALIERHATWGAACHQITPEFDRGPVLSKQEFPLDATECHESLNIKVQMASRNIAARVAADFLELWRCAEPQGEGSYWPLPSLERRIIDFTQPVEAVLRHIRAFGRAESLASAANRWLSVTRATGWQEQHRHPPGRIVHIHDQTIVAAAADGFVAMIETRLADAIVELALRKRGLSCRGAPLLSLIPLSQVAT